MAKVKLKIHNGHGLYRQNYGTIDGQVTREQGRSGPTYLNSGRPFIADARPIRIQAQTADELLTKLKASKPRRPTTDRLVGHFFEGSMFGIGTMPELIPTTPEARLAATGGVYDVAHDRAVGKAENDAHKLDGQWSFGLLILAGLEVITFLVLVLLNHRGAH